MNLRLWNITNHKRYLTLMLNRIIFEYLFAHLFTMTRFGNWLEILTSQGINYSLDNKISIVLIVRDYSFQHASTFVLTYDQIETFRIFFFQWQQQSAKSIYFIFQILLLTSHSIINPLSNTNWLQVTFTRSPLFFIWLKCRNFNASWFAEHAFHDE